MVKRQAAIADLLRQRLFSGLHLGLIRPGARLPTVRGLARELGADPRVILAAYRDLEREGLVDLKPRSGSYVAEAGDTAARQQRRRTDWLVDVLVEALERRISAPELPERLRQSLETVQLRAACFECNADQIASLSGELRADYGLNAVGFELEALTVKHGVPEAVAGADLLVTTPFHGQEVRAASRRLGKPCIEVSLRPDLFAEIARRLPTEPAYLVVADARFAAKAPRLFAAIRRPENLRPRVVGRDDVDSIPDDAPTYVTRLARERLGDSSLTRRVIPIPRVFSSDTARQLFSFIVRANLAAVDGTSTPARGSP